jgi:hypothetical protein
MGRDEHNSSRRRRMLPLPLMACTQTHETKKTILISWCAIATLILCRKFRIDKETMQQCLVWGGLVSDVYVACNYCNNIRLERGET